MAWIEIIPNSDPRATAGKLARLYKSLVEPDTGAVDNVLRIHSLMPDTMDGHFKLYRSVMRAGPLSVRERETLGVAISAYNECHY